MAQAAEEAGVPLTRVADDRLGELLSIFPLTVAVQRIALEAAETLGVDPDTFGLDRPAIRAGIALSYERVRIRAGLAR